MSRIVDLRLPEPPAEHGAEPGTEPTEERTGQTGRFAETLNKAGGPSPTERGRRERGADEDSLLLALLLAPLGGIAAPLSVAPVEVRSPASSGGAVAGGPQAGQRDQGRGAGGAGGEGARAAGEGGESRATARTAQTSAQDEEDDSPAARVRHASAESARAGRIHLGGALFEDATTVPPDEGDDRAAGILRAGALAALSAESAGPGIASGGGAGEDGASRGQDGARPARALQPAAKGEDEEPGGRKAGRSRTDAIFGHAADAAADLANFDPNRNAGPDPGTAFALRHDAPGTTPGEAPVTHAHFGHNHAELVFGDGADRIQLTVSMDHLGVHVHAHAASAGSAAALLASTDELRRALEQHGLSLSDFSAEGGDEGDEGEGGRGRRPAPSHTAPGGRGRAGVRVIL